jgi:hypothetical protein
MSMSGFRVHVHVNVRVHVARVHDVHVHDDHVDDVMYR